MNKKAKAVAKAICKQQGTEQGQPGPYLKATKKKNNKNNKKRFPTKGKHNGSP